MPLFFLIILKSKWHKSTCIYFHILIFQNVSPVKSRSPPDMTEVNIELVSTWGHKEFIGLTELQFFDKNRKLIPVSSSNVVVHGAKENRNLVDVIFNGKGKVSTEL